MYVTEQDILQLSRRAVATRNMLRDRDPQGFRRALEQARELIPYSREAYERYFHSIYTIGNEYYYHRNVECFDKLIKELEYCYGLAFKEMLNMLRKD
jgi:hypothetical protein